MTELISGQKKSVKDKSYCVKGLALDWYKRLLLALSLTTNQSLIKNIKEQLTELESRHINLSPHKNIDLDLYYREEAKKSLPRTPYNIGSKNCSLKSKLELYDTRINDKEDKTAKEIRGK